MGIIAKPAKYSNRFPFIFFTSVFITVALTVAFAQFGYDTMPRNSLSDCKKEFKNTVNEAAGFKFCECIHNNGEPLDVCLAEFENTKK